MVKHRYSRKHWTRQRKLQILQDCWLPRDQPYIQLQESHLMNPWMEQQWESSWTTQILQRKDLRRIYNIIDQRPRVQAKDKSAERSWGMTMRVKETATRWLHVKQPKKSKWSTPWEPVFYNVYSIQSFRITAICATDRRIICSDTTQFKMVNAVINTAKQEREEFEILPPTNPDFQSKLK